MRSIGELYEEWADKNNMGGGFIPFARNDNWAGHVVVDFAEFVLAEGRKEVLHLIDEVEKEFDKIPQDIPSYAFTYNQVLAELRKRLG